MLSEAAIGGLCYKEPCCAIDWIALCVSYNLKRGLLREYQHGSAYRYSRSKELLRKLFINALHFGSIVQLFHAATSAKPSRPATQADFGGMMKVSVLTKEDELISRKRPL
jgi:hypothetical protein